HELMQKRIFAPLEMKSATCTTAQAMKAGDIPSPHRKNVQGKIAPIPWYRLDEPDPAGSIHLSIRDLAKFLRLQMGDGTWQGKRLVSAQSLAETHTPQIVVRRE